MALALPPAAPISRNIAGACSVGSGGTTAPTGSLESLPAGTTGPSPLFNSQVVPYASLTGPYAYVAAGAGLRNQGYGLINLTWPGGSTSNLVAAYLIWSIINGTVPPSNGTLNGANVAGTWTAYATPSPCWTITYIYTFVADVTSLVVNGVNNLTNFPSGVTSGADPWSASVIGPLDDSASLIAIYENSSSTALRQVTVYSGASPVGSPAPNTQTATLNYSTANSSSARTTFIVADGQLPHNYADWNGTTLSNNSFPGDDPHESKSTWSYGNLSDTRTFNVNVAVGSNSTTALIGSPPSTDCLTWVGQVVSVGVAAAKGPYSVVFQEQGLPNGTSWNVTANGVTGAGTVAHATSSIAFSLGNGSYTYSLGTIPGYVAPGSSAFSVAGGPVFIRVIFHQVLYVVTFNESALPAGALWWIDFSNTSQGLSQNLSSYSPTVIFFIVANGTYNFTSGETGLYRAEPARGSVTVRGSDVLTTISFVPPPLFNVTIREHGLPSASSWGTSTYTNWGIYYNTTANPSFVLQLPNTSGSSDYLYPYAVTGYSAVSYLPFIVSGATTVTVNYTKVYTAQLFETGLPRNTYWQSYLYNSSTGNSYLASGTPYLNFSVVNGSYAFTIEAEWGYTATPATGNLTVSGANVSQTIVFTASPAYILSFNETGLVPGANWTVMLGLPNGTYITQTSNATSIQFPEPNGTYSFFPVATGYDAYPSEGSVGVSGRNISYPIDFTRLFLATFTEAGLPSGTYWEVYFHYEYLGSYSSTFASWVSNGTYSWTALSSGSYAPSPSTGSMTISGSNEEQTINYSSPTSPTYGVTFSESGLAPRTNWSIELNGYTESTLGGSINFTEANGSFEFYVSGAAGYSATPPLGTLNVSGAAASATIDFSQGTTMYDVTFTESGLPNGATWYVNVTGELGMSATVSGVYGTEIQIALPDGHYTYAAATSTNGWTTPASGGFTVAGGPLDEPVPFTSTSVPQYLVTFTESGLPNGATWFVNISGEPTLTATVSDGSGMTVTIELPDASYTYSAATSSADWTTPASGGFTVAGAPLNEPVPFTSTSVSEYAVTFTESGLPTGATWYVNISGQPALSATVSGSSGTTVSIDLSNASYTYVAATNSKGWTTPSTDGFTVAGAALNEPLPFTAPSVAQYQVTFQEAGLPNGATWYVNITGQPALSATVSASSGTELTTTLPSGTYTFSASTSSKGWTTTAGGSLSITGASQSVNVAFTTTGGISTPASTPMSTSWLWLVVAIIVGIALLLLVIVGWRRRKKDERTPPAPASAGPPTGPAP